MAGTKTSRAARSMGAETGGLSDKQCEINTFPVDFKASMAYF